MKNQILTLFILSILFTQPKQLFSQAGEWTWMHGSSTPINPGNFGVQGVSSPTNEPPGVYETCEWTDLNGNFWIFGGYGNSIRYASLWKYDVTTNEWTWMHGPQGSGSAVFGTKGVSSPANQPAGNSHGGWSWTDLQGNLWMWGGASMYNSLWKYDISINEWTWMQGSNSSGQAGTYGIKGVPDPANSPGVRWEGATCWTDTSGNLWMFGGANNNTNAFNDLWKYDVITNEWTWMNGDSTFNSPTVYGTKGVEDPMNNPGGRTVYTHWTDNDNNLWLFGGAYSAIPPHGYLNDLWRYNISTNAWTWMNGSNGIDQPGIYGAQCTGNSLNTPGSRFENRAVCTDQNGNFWLMGGGGGQTGGQFSEIWNDLWMYCVTENKWVWVSGTTSTQPVGNWGTIGVSSPTNMPDGRAGTSMGCDLNGNIFLFGGSSWGFATCNDLWRYQIDPNCYPCVTSVAANFTSPTDICPGTCVDFTNLSSNATSYLWSFSGANPAFSTDANPLSICYASPGSYDVELIASNSNGSDTLLLPNYITVFPAPGPQSIIQIGDTLFALTGSSTYQWYYNGNQIPGATDYYVAADSSGNYNVVCTDTNGCEVEAAIFDVIAGISSAFGEKDVQLFPNPTGDHLYIQLSANAGNKITAITIYDALGGLVDTKIPVEVKNKTEIVIDTHDLSSGIYFVELTGLENKLRKKFVKE